MAGGWLRRGPLKSKPDLQIDFAVVGGGHAAVQGDDHSAEAAKVAEVRR